MDKLRSFVAQNRTRFDDYPLPTDAERHMAQRLRSTGQRRTLYRTLIAVAAVACLAAITWIIPKEHAMQTDDWDAGIEGLVFADITTYYTMQINRTMDSIRMVAHHSSNPGIVQIVEEMERIAAEKAAFETTTMTEMEQSERTFATLQTFYTTQLRNLRLLLNIAERKHLAYTPVDE